jgi:ferredoxin
MLCSRECPDWCIYIEGHKERRQPKGEGKRAKAYNVLDRFAIDYALCMYCGICVEVCPYDALFWSPEFEYAEGDITRLTHEKDRLADWMYTVLPPGPLEEGAEGPELKAAAPVTTTPAATPAPGRPEADQVVPTERDGKTGAAPPEAAAVPATAASSAAVPAAASSAAGRNGASAAEAAAIRQEVYEEEMAKGSDPRVAEGRAKAAEMRARKGTRGPGGS